MPKININAIQKLIYESRFRRLFPDMEGDFTKFFSKPGCDCNNPMYVKIATSDQLREFFANDTVELDDDIVALINAEPPTEWWVINTTADSLLDKLNALPKGNKTVSIARSGNEVTAVVRNLDYDF